MNLLVQPYNINKYNNHKVSFRNNTSSYTDFQEDYLPDITPYDTGINDPRLESLIVEKRERMIQQFPVPPEYTYFDDKYGITRLKPHLYIRKIVVKPEYLRQGACRDAEKKIVELSKKEGYEGRVILDARPILGKRDYIINPALAHWANGFRFYSSAMTELMLEVLSGLRSPEHGPAGGMYYPLGSNP